MKIIKFKTNIHCEGCIKSVTPFLNNLNNVDAWKVDLEDSNKILEVSLDDDNETAVLEAVKKAGFEIEKL
jgi:copper chaperone